MPRMQDTAEEPSPSPSTRAGGYGTAWPKPSRVPASHPTVVTGKVLLFFLFLCFSHQLGTFQGWAAPFPSQQRGGAEWGAEPSPHTRAVSLCSSSVSPAMLSPCSSVSLSR